MTRLYYGAILAHAPQKRLPKRCSNPTSPAHVQLPGPRSYLPVPISELPDSGSYTPAYPGSDEASGTVFGLQNGIHFYAIPPYSGGILGLTPARSAALPGSVSRSAAGTLLLPRMSRSQIPDPSSQTPDLSSQIPDPIPRLNPARRSHLTMARFWDTLRGARGSLSRSAVETLLLPRMSPG